LRSIRVQWQRINNLRPFSIAIYNDA